MLRRPVQLGEATFSSRHQKGEGLHVYSHAEVAASVGLRAITEHDGPEPENGLMLAIGDKPTVLGKSSS